MKKSSAKREAPAKAVDADEALPEYDFSGARPNPYAKRLSGDAIRIVLDPDVAELFPTSVHVNRALRAVAKANGGPKGRRRQSRSE